MHWFDLIAILLVLAAAFSYLNYRWLKLPTTIGLMALTLLVSVALVAIGKFFPAVIQLAKSVVQQLDFDRALLQGMLGFLLFAGSLHLDLSELARRKWTITVLATLGVLVSTSVIGGLTWCIVTLLGISLPFVYCLLFGALVSPTDPIAVLGLLKKSGHRFSWKSPSRASPCSMTASVSSCFLDCRNWPPESTS